jgi:hypothetical protein
LLSWTWAAYDSVVQDDPQIEQDLIAGRKIAAIKRYRETTGVGLREAKAAMDRREAMLLQAGRVQPGRVSGFSPLMVVLGVFVVFALIVVMILIYIAGKALG